MLAKRSLWLQFTLLEEFAPSGNPIAQFIGTVNSADPDALTSEKQLWMDPVSALTMFAALQ
jgi:hypothetical protein